MGKRKHPKSMPEPFPQQPKKVSFTTYFKLQFPKMLAGIDRLNERIATHFQDWVRRVFQTEKFTATRRAILALEGIVLFGLGATLMQIGEWLLAIAVFVLLGFLLMAKSLTWNTHWALRSLAFLCSIALCTGLIAITTLHKPENEPWTNLQKLILPKDELRPRWYGSSVKIEWPQTVFPIPLPPSSPITPDVKITSSLNPKGMGATFWITAPPSIPIESIDIIVHMDVSIGNAVQVSDVPDVKFLNTPRSHPVIVELGEKGKPSTQILVKPSIETGSILPELRIYCPKLLAGESFIMRLGSITTNPVTRDAFGNLQFPEQALAPQRKPKWIKIVGTYETGTIDNPHRYPINYTESFDSSKK